MSEEKKKKYAKILVIVLVIIVMGIALVSVYNTQINNEVGVDTAKRTAWDTQSNLIEKVTELNESLAQTGVDVDFKLKDVCYSSDYKKPNNITNYIGILTDMTNVDAAVGCFRDDSKIAVIVISTGQYGVQYVRRMDFYEGATNIKVYDYIESEHRVECTLDMNKSISCN